RVAPGMVADPVPLRMRAFGEGAGPRPHQFFADDEERRFDVAPRQHVEHVRCHLGGRAVVEGEAEIEHKHFISGKVRWMSSRASTARAGTHETQVGVSWVPDSRPTAASGMTV